MKKNLLKWGLLSLFCAIASVVGAQTTFTVSPDNNEQVSSLDFITVTADEEISLNADKLKSVVVRTVLGNDTVAFAVMGKQVQDQGVTKSYMLLLSDEITEGGKYYITIPEGVFNIVSSGTTNDPIEARFTVIPPTVEYSLTYEPENGAVVESLPSVTIGYSGGIDCSWNYSASVTKDGEPYEVKVNCEANYDEDAAWTDPAYSCTLSFTPELTEAGEYEITLPKGYFNLGLMDVSDEIVLDYTVTGNTEDVEGIVITLLTEMPEQLDKIAADQRIEVSLANAPETANVKFKVIDEADSSIVRSGYFNYDEATGNYVWENPSDLTLYQGHKYDFTLYVYENDHYNADLLATSVIFTVEGMTKATEYSEVKFIGIDPDENTKITVDDSSFTLTFTGNVKIDEEKSFVNMGVGYHVPFYIKSGNGEEYSDTWTLTVPEYVMEDVKGGVLYLSVYAEDENGLTIKESQDGYLMFVYSVSGTDMDIADYVFTLSPADGEYVKSVSDITVKANGQLIGNWDVFTEEDLFVYNVETGEKVASVEMFKYTEVYESNGLTLIGYIYHLNKEITEDGTYTYTIPASAYKLGSDESGLSEEMKVTFHVGDDTGINRVLQDTTENGVYYNLNGQRVTTPRNGIYILNGKKVLVK